MEKLAEKYRFDENRLMLVSVQSSKLEQNVSADLLHIFTSHKQVKMRLLNSAAEAHLVLAIACPKFEIWF